MDGAEGGAKAEGMGAARRMALRIAGIFGFLCMMAAVQEVVLTVLSSFMFLIDGESAAWGVFYVATALLLAAGFLCAVFATALAAFFAGRAEYRAALWQCSVCALAFAALYLAALLAAGADGAERLFALRLAAVLAAFCAAAFACLFRADGFSWRRLLPCDAPSRLCRKLVLSLLAASAAAAFLAAHRFF
ncbi:MAG: hypothetical protein K2H09_08935 [Treponemataceae bacterium]|nr:hypothetical protein [Treponemataceae bacterium]